jgi:hypothetical protein
MRVSKAEQNKFRNAVLTLISRDPNGYTLSELQRFLWEEFEIERSKGAISYVIKAIRDACAEVEDDLFVVCDNPGDGYSEWRYRLTARLDDSIEWATWRAGSIESQLQTMIAYYSSIISNSDSRSEVWKAKTARKALMRALEDVMAEVHPE